MNVPERIYVTMTSWYKRIGNVKTVLETILNQTIKPYKIILNLCTEDFPDMEEDLPEDLLQLINDNKGYIELYWFIENYKAWKKHLHTLDIVEDDDLIISVDDDHLYPEYFIENMYVSYCFYHKQHPVTLNKIVLTHNMWCFNGPATLYRKKDLGEYKKYMTYDVLHNCIDDIFLGILMAINGTIILPEIFHMPPDDEMLFNDLGAWTDKNSADRHSESRAPIVNLHDITLPSMEDSLKRHYFKNKQSIFTPTFWDIVVNLLSEAEEKYKNPPAALQFLFDTNKKYPLYANISVDFKSLGLDIERTSDKTRYIGNNNLVITLSSWNKRIDNVKPVFESILNNTILPDKIYLNLACTDFGYDADDIPDFEDLYDNELFPDDLYFFIKSSNVPIYINWYNDTELKSWKKHLKPIKECQENDVIICIDDDMIYAPTFIETMIKSYNYYGRNYAISSFCNCYCQGGFPFCGYCTLYTPGFFKDFDKYITPEILHKFPEDNHLLNILNINHHMLLPVIGRSYLFDMMNFNEGESNFGNLVFDEKWWNSYKDIMDESVKIIDSTCTEREEMKCNWTPNYFNFSIYNLHRFLIEEAPRKDEIPFKYIYEAVEKHLNENPGQGAEMTGLDEKIEKIIL